MRKFSSLPKKKRSKSEKGDRSYPIKLFAISPQQQRGGREGKRGSYRKRASVSRRSEPVRVTKALGYKACGTKCGVAGAILKASSEEKKKVPRSFR